MNLYLLRHGEAVSRAASDSARSLTERGRTQVQAVAREFRRRKLPLDCCLVSPYRRAQQSATLFLAEVNPQLQVHTEALLTPEGRALDIMQVVERQQQENILLVSHNPLLSELRALLVHGHTRSLFVLGTGELVGLGLEVVGLGLGAGRFHLLPEQLGAHA